MHVWIKFPNEFLPIFKKGKKKKDSNNLKSNYKPVSILPNISKIFEIYIYDQLVNHFDQNFSKY